MAARAFIAAAATLVVATAAYGAQIVGAPGDDVIAGTPAADRIYAKAGDDLLRGGAGDDVMWADPRADRQHVGAGGDVLHALADDDQMDVLNCGSGRDIAWLSQNERGLYRIAGCEVVKIVVPSAEQLAEENEDWSDRDTGDSH